MQGGSLYPFYDGLWYDPLGTQTHGLPNERWIPLSQPVTIFDHQGFCVYEASAHRDMIMCILSSCRFIVTMTYQVEGSKCISSRNNELKQQNLLQA